MKSRCEEVSRELEGLKRAVGVVCDRLTHLERAVGDLLDTPPLQQCPHRPRCPRCGGVIEEWVNRSHGKVVPYILCRRCRTAYELVERK